MLSLEPIIAQRLAALPEVAGWEVRTGTLPEARGKLPALDIRCAGAAVTDSRAGAVMVSPEWAVTIAVQRGPLAAGQIDGALAAIIASLHNFRAGQVGGRGWEPMELKRAATPTFSDSGVVGMMLVFTTSARYMAGQ